MITFKKNIIKASDDYGVCRYIIAISASYSCI